MLLRACFVVPGLVAVALLVAAVATNTDDSAFDSTVRAMVIAASIVSATVTALLALRMDESPGRWALAAAVAGAAWVGFLLLALWLGAVLYFDPD